MDHSKARVILNGHPQSTTPCLWSVTLNTVFDPKIPVGSWPPSGAIYVGSEKRLTEAGFPMSTAELWIAGGKHEQEPFQDFRRRYPHLVDGEHVFFVKANLSGAKRTGALRVQVLGGDGALYRWVDYRLTTLTDESDAERIFKRSLWFEVGSE